MRRKLRSYIEHAKDLDTVAFELLGAVDRVEGNPDLYLAHLSLMTRVLQDLRVAVTTAQMGYTMQSWTVATSAFEAAHTMGYLCAKPTRAAEWWEHKSKEKSFCATYPAIQGTFGYLGLGDTAIEREELTKQEYAHYTSLCIAKHVNPLAERTRYIRGHGSQTKLTITPVLSERRIREAQFGLALACRSATLAVWLFHKAHFQQAGPLLAKIVALGTESARLLVQWRNVDI